MKAVLISHNQALTEGVEDILDKLTIRGFTQWTDVNGRGSSNGESHMGTHTWPSLNNVLIIVIPDEKVKPLLEKLSDLNQKDEEEGLRAFVWNIESTI
jgi:nitrogen regulatory protein PII